MNDPTHPLAADLIREQKRQRGTDRLHRRQRQHIASVGGWPGFRVVGQMPRTQSRRRQISAPTALPHASHCLAGVARRRPGRCRGRIPPPRRLCVVPAAGVHAWHDGWPPKEREDSSKIDRKASRPSPSPSGSIRTLPIKPPKRINRWGEPAEHLSTCRSSSSRALVASPPAAHTLLGSKISSLSLLFRRRALSINGGRY